MSQENTGVLTTTLHADEDGVLPDYGGLLTNGVRGKYAGKITHIKGRPIVRAEPVQRLVTFSPEVSAAFPTDEAINDALRSLMAARAEEAPAS